MTGFTKVPARRGYNFPPVRHRVMDTAALRLHYHYTNIVKRGPARGEWAAISVQWGTL